MRRTFAAALSAIAVIGAAGTWAVTSAASAGAPSSAHIKWSKSALKVHARQRHLKLWEPPAPATRAPMWRVPSHGGAQPTTASAASAAPCKASQLRTQYWTSFPALATIISGFNVTNAGPGACALPRTPGAISVLSRTGRLVTADFASFGSKAAPVAAPAVLAGPRPGLTLRPGGTAVVLLYTRGRLLAHESCLRVPAHGSLRVGLGASALTVQVPDSALSSCSVVTVSGFVTWPQAKAIVGVPVPESTATGALRLPARIKALYAPAP